MGVSGWGWVAGEIDYKANSASNLLEVEAELESRNYFFVRGG